MRKTDGDPLGDLRLLRARVDSIAAALHMKVAQFALIPDTTQEGNDVLSVVFALDVEAVETADQTAARKDGDAFTEILGAEFGEDAVLTDEEAEGARKLSGQKAEAMDDIDAWLEELGDDE